MGLGRLRLAFPAVLMLVTACAAGQVRQEPSATLPAARWDQQPEAAVWTRAALSALDGPAAPLVALVPKDIDAWCPGYDGASAEERKAFWIALVSSLAKHESTWRPAVSGGEGRWHGLLQISPATARAYGCAASDAAGLKDGAMNLRCGLRIMAATVHRDGVIAAGGGGIAADWGPFSQKLKRADMAAWTGAQPYCEG